MTESEASSRGCAVIARRSRRYCGRVAVVRSDLLLPKTNPVIRSHSSSSGSGHNHVTLPPCAEALSATLGP